MAIPSILLKEPDPPANRGGTTIELPGDWRDERRGTSLRDILRIVFRRRGMVIGIFLATVASTCLWMWLEGDAYETAARVMIRFARDDADPKTSLSASSTRLIPANRPDINTEAELIRSYALVARVVTTLQLDKPPVEVPPPALLPRIKFELRRAYRAVREFAEEVEVAAGFRDRLSNREKAIVAVMRGLKVESVKESSVVKVSLRSRMKAGAGHVLNTLLDFYREHRLAAEKNPREVEFFASQAALYGRALRDKEQQLYHLKKKFDIASFSEQIKLTLDNISTARQAASGSASRLAATDARVRMLQRQVEAEKPNKVISEITSRNLEVDFLSQKQAAVELEKQRLLSKYGAGHPSVQDADDELRRIGELLARAPSTVPQSRTTAPNTTFEGLQKELLSATQERAALDAQLKSEMAAIARYTSQLNGLRDAEVAHNQLTREVSLDEETYRLHERNAHEARSADALNSKGITSIVIVDPAEDPILPSGIRKTYLLGGSVLLGLILAFGLVFIADAVDHSVGSPEEVERYLGHPVYGSLSYRKSARDLSPPRAAMLKQFMAIASRLDSAAAGGRKTITFVAASPGAGASTVAAGVAWALSAELGKKVLLLEPNGHSKVVSKLLPADAPAPAPANGVKPEWPEKILEVSPTLRLSSSDFHVRDVTEKLVSDRIQQLSQQMAEYEYILIDVGSAAQYHERMGAARASAGVVVVVQADRTRHEVLERMEQEFTRENISVLGAILNKRRFPIPEGIYKLI